MIPSKETTVRNAAIDVMRGGSILWIVGYWHLFDYTSAFPEFKNPLSFRLTAVALGLFMFLSGYLLGGKGIRTKQDVVNFFQSRFVRIYPPFLLATCLFYLFGLSGWKELAKSAVGLSMFLPPSPPTLWFISLLLVFCAVAPLLILCADRFSPVLYLLVCSAATLVLYSLGACIEPRSAIYFPIFAGGVLLARRPEIEATANVLVLTGVFLLADLLFSWNLLSAKMSGMLYSALSLAGALLVFKCFRDIPSRNLPLLSFWTVLSYGGYFMYLFHRPMFHLFKRVYFPEQGSWQIAYLVGVCLPAIVLASYLGQKA